MNATRRTIAKIRMLPIGLDQDRVKLAGTVASMAACLGMVAGCGADDPQATPDGSAAVAGTEPSTYPAENAGGTLPGAGGGASSGNAVGGGGSDAAVPGTTGGAGASAGSGATSPGGSSGASGSTSVAGGTGIGGGSATGGSTSVSGGTTSAGGELSGDGGNAAAPGGGTESGGDGAGAAAGTTSSGGTGESSCVPGVQTGDACDPTVDVEECVRSTRTCLCQAAGTWDCQASTGAGGSGGSSDGTDSGGTTGDPGGAGGGESGGVSGGESGGASAGGDSSGAGGEESGGTGGGDPPDPVASGEDDFAECGHPDLPGMNELPSISKLPDPFTFKFGDGGTISTKAEWKCRRSEINACAQEYIYGAKPVPDSVSATFSGGKLNITVEDEGKSIEFSVPISGGDPSDPKALLLKYGGSFAGNLPGMPSEVVQSAFPEGTLAVDGKSRSGKFYDLYGSNHAAGELIAWAWGVSRVIDALEMTPEAGIDPTKVAVHGCSRYGKGALAAGAFDSRVALTIPEEAGSGGGAAWRMIATDSAAQPLSSACTECVWFHKDFCSFDGKEDKLPIDMHEVMAMVAPRGLLYLDQTSADWLGRSTTYWSSHATREVYRALGEEGAFTYNQIAGSSHCTTPQGQSQYVAAYVNYYLLGKGEKPAGAVNKGGASEFNASQWIDWETPTLQ